LPGQPGHRVDPPGQPGHTGFFLPPFFHQPGPVPALGRPGPGSTRRAGPGFKTIVTLWNNKIREGNPYPQSLEIRVITWTRRVFENEGEIIFYLKITFYINILKWYKNIKKFNFKKINFKF
jgi:hypothetical protein